MPRITAPQFTPRGIKGFSPPRIAGLPHGTAIWQGVMRSGDRAGVFRA
ncbi:hypothetical protein [Roseicitreum antarcticum]|nr:hypothetical protein [Roseicitreum antarcticum]